MADIEEQQGDVPEVEFALTPGQAGDAIIDYTSATGIKIYKNATAPLETKHDLSAEKLQNFLDSLEQRAIDHDWEAILDIPNEDEETYTHLIRKHGSLSLKQVRAHAETYVRNNTRATQDSQQMASCILKSLTRMQDLPSISTKMNSSLGRETLDHVSSRWLFVNLMSIRLRRHE